MARPLRLSFENAVYHIIARENRREDIFYLDKDKEVFVDKMNETFTKKGKQCQMLRPDPPAFIRKVTLEDIALQH